MRDKKIEIDYKTKERKTVRKKVLYLTGSVELLILILFVELGKVKLFGNLLEIWQLPNEIK